MPATNFTWGRSEDSPIFQVFGGKRKSSLGEQDSSITTKSKRQCTEYHVTSLSCKGGEESEMESLDTQPRPTDQGIPNGQYGYMACPDMVQPCRHLAESQVWNTRVPPLPDSSGDHGNNNNNNCGIFNNNVSGFNAGAELNNNQNDMIMDLNDEVYSTAAPPQNLNPFPNTTPIPPHIPGAHSNPLFLPHPFGSILPLNPQTDAEYEAACNMMASMEGEGAPNPQQYNTAYCDQFCVGGHRSPSSGTVRCQCKPSWEGLHDVRPYVSDYY